MAAPIADPAASGRVRRWARRARAAPRDLPRPRHGRGRRRGAALHGVRAAHAVVARAARVRAARRGRARAVRPRRIRAGRAVRAGLLPAAAALDRHLRRPGAVAGALGRRGGVRRCRGRRGGRGVAAAPSPRMDGAALGGRGVGRGGGAAGADALRRLPVGPGRVRSARRAVAAGGRRRRGAAAVVRDGAGRARARRGRAAPRPSARGGPPGPRCWRSSRSRRARSPRCCRPRGRLPSAP